MENMIVKTVFEICFAYIVDPLTPQKHTTLHLCCLNFVAQWGVFPSEDEAVTQ